MPLEYRSKMKTTIYGCDICQMTCPYNKGKDFHFHSQMEPKLEDVQPVLEELLFINNKEFKNRFGYLAGAWRGKKPLQRNAIIALVNSNSRADLPNIWKVAKEDVRPEIVATAIWAISELTKEMTPEILHELTEVAKRLDSPVIEKELELIKDEGLF